MRSRFSAYATGNYQYVLDTYAQEKRHNLSTQTLQDHVQGTLWLTLEVLQAKADRVEFVAIYRSGNQFFRMHERSRFVQEQGRWVYLDGEMLAQTGEFKPGRNDPCPCSSGKKFKKCCGNR